MSTPSIDTVDARITSSHDMIIGRLKSNNFDGLRLVFASMVVLFHISVLSNAPSLAIIHQSVSSLFAVQAFFFVSGFLVVMSYESTISLMSYARKRVFRIFPAYIFCILAAATLLVFLTDLSPTEYYLNPEWRRYVGFNLALSNFVQPNLPGVFNNQFESAVNGSLWTIKLEVMFYCTVPFIVWATRRFGYNRILALIFFGSIVWSLGFRILGEATNTDFYMRLAKQLPGQLGFFAGGAWAYYRTRQGLAPAPAWSAVTGIVVYAVTDGYVNLLLAPACVTAIVYYAAVSVSRIWSAERWGDLSYGLYLYHFPIVQAAVALGLFEVSPVVGFLLVIIFSLSVAILSWHFLEKRALVLGRRLFSQSALE